MAAPCVSVLDYGLGNLRSVTRGLERAGASVEITDDPASLASADGLVLPGVGAFREGVENAAPYREAIGDAVAAGVPLFGICLGMQMLLSDSEEGEAGEGAASGLAYIPGTNVRFAGECHDARLGGRLTVPHMGWNDLTVTREHPLVEGVDGEYVYFVHSYYAVPDDADGTVAETTYGDAFPAVVAAESGQVFGTQFHPEKSGEAGLQILENFVDICG